MSDADRIQSYCTKRHYYYISEILRGHETCQTQPLQPHQLSSTNFNSLTTILKMNFYPPPPTIQAEIYARIPSHLRCTGQPTEWRSGSARPASDIFLEGPVYTQNGDLYIVDVPYGRILKIDKNKEVTECIRYDGEPNGLVVRDDGCLVIADYKQVHTYLPAPLPQAQFDERLMRVKGHPPILPHHQRPNPPLNPAQPGALQRPERPDYLQQERDLFHRPGPNRNDGPVRVCIPALSRRKARLSRIERDISERVGVIP